jgi:hypothetical protein
LQKLLNDSEEDPDRLPVLQHILRRLWELRGGDRRITLARYEAIGGWREALARDAEAVLARFADDEAGVARIFQWITAASPSGGKEIRRPRPFGEFAAVSGLTEARAREIVRAFAVRDFLRADDAELNPDTWVDLTHESVIWNWPRLAGWLRRENEAANRLRFLRESAENKVQITGSLLREAENMETRLRESPVWASRYLPFEARGGLNSWIDSCRKARKRRALTRRAWIAAAAFLALAVGAYLWYDGRRARIRELVGPP